MFHGNCLSKASAVIAPVIIIAIWTSIWATRKAPKETAPSHANLRNMALLVYQNKPFMKLVLLYGLMTMAIATITAGLPFAAIYLIFDGEASFLSTISKNLGILSFLFAAFVIGAMCSQVFWVFLSNILGKSAALIAGWARILYFSLSFSMRFHRRISPQCLFCFCWLV